MINAHVKDGIALCRYFSWLEKTMENDNTLTEISAAKVLENFRRYVYCLFSLYKFVDQHAKKNKVPLTTLNLLHGSKTSKKFKKSYFLQIKI